MLCVYISVVCTLHEQDSLSERLDDEKREERRESERKEGDKRFERQKEGRRRRKSISHREIEFEIMGVILLILFSSFFLLSSQEKMLFQNASAKTPLLFPLAGETLCADASSSLCVCVLRSYGKEARDRMRDHRMRDTHLSIL